MTSKHASDRMQQRGIPPLIVNWLMAFGHHEHDGKGGVIHYFDKISRRRLSSEFGSAVVRRLDDYLDAYLVRYGDVIVTTGWRFKRVRRS